MVRLILFFSGLCLACSGLSDGYQADTDAPVLREGAWRFSMNLGEAVLPFNAVFVYNNGVPTFVVKNAEEEIFVRNLVLENDSLSMTLPVFGSVIRGKVLSDSTFVGYWYNESRGVDYKIPIEASYGKTNRFEMEVTENSRDFSGRWEVIFKPNGEDNCKAIGVFQQEGEKIRGTFLTEMGDYRFLEGNVSGNHMMLSGFDGSHAFLFDATLNEGDEINGRFWSGIHWVEDWFARRNESFSLAHPDSLTLLKENAQPFGFTFPDLQNNPVSFTDRKFQNKVVIVQIMGSWCPNCADESYVFAEFHRHYQKEGLEIVAVAYERFDVFDDAVKSINRFREGTGARYQFLFGGKASKKEASKDFPMIEGIHSFPTALFIDRGGNIRKIHTGFYGPGSGSYFMAYREELELFVEKLLREKINS